MMVNHLGDNDEYGEIILDSKESFAKKIFDLLTHQEILEILELTHNPITIQDICARTNYSRTKVYKRISQLLDSCLVFAVRKENTNFRKYGAWMYVKSFYVVSVRCGQMCKCNHCADTIVEILPKRKFYGQILKTIRNFR